MTKLLQAITAFKTGKDIQTLSKGSDKPAAATPRTVTIIFPGNQYLNFGNRQTCVPDPNYLYQAKTHI